jgi:hypothetical protein
MFVTFILSVALQMKVTLFKFVKLAFGGESKVTVGPVVPSEIETFHVFVELKINESAVLLVLTTKTYVSLIAPVAFTVQVIVIDSFSLRVKLDGLIAVE